MACLAQKLIDLMEDLYMCTRFPASFEWNFEWGLRTPNHGEEDAVGGRGWYRSKERWLVPIDPP